MGNYLVYLLPARDSGRAEAGCGGRRQRRLPDLAAAEAVVGRPAPRRRGRAEAAGFVGVGAHLKMKYEWVALVLPVKELRTPFLKEVSQHAEGTTS